MTDDRPRPQYGEYAPAGYVPPSTVPEPEAQKPAEPAPAPARSPQRTRDVVLTTVLILVGVLDVVGGFGRFANLAASLREVYVQQGLGTFTSDALANDMGIAINVTRVVLLAAGIGFGLIRLARHKTAFWFPFAAGVLALLVVVVSVLVVIVIDPALADYVTRSTAP